MQSNQSIYMYIDVSKELKKFKSFISVDSEGPQNLIDWTRLSSYGNALPSKTCCFMHNMYDKVLATEIDLKIRAVLTRA